MNGRCQWADCLRDVDTLVTLRPSRPCGHRMPDFLSCRDCAREKVGRTAPNASPCGVCRERSHVAIDYSELDLDRVAANQRDRARRDLEARLDALCTSYGLDPWEAWRRPRAHERLDRALGVIGRRR